jgi:hypothetical protein
MKRAFFISIVCIFVLVGIWAFDWPRCRERPNVESETTIGFSLRPERQVIKVGETLRFSATVFNHVASELVLVEPGDGSERGWRTALIEWLAEFQFESGYGSRCGNTNALRADGVFVPKPGETHQLRMEWVQVPPFGGPGQYRVFVRYVNQPGRVWRGVRLGKHDEAAMEAVRRSYSVSLVSNTVEVVVKE